jgi:hypothetical protein
MHYYNSGRFAPGLLDPLNPTLGISNSKVELIDGFLVCTFTREKSMQNKQNYLDLDKKFHILAATGALSNEGGKI